MGRRDVLMGIQNGPRGARQSSSGGGGGVSPLVLALLGLLTYKAFKGRGAQTPAAPEQGTPRGGTTGGKRAQRRARQSHSRSAKQRTWRCGGLVGAPGAQPADRAA